MCLRKAIRLSTRGEKSICNYYCYYYYGVSVDRYLVPVLSSIPGINSTVFSWMSCTHAKYLFPSVIPWLMLIHAFIYCLFTSAYSLFHGHLSWLGLQVSLPCAVLCQIVLLQYLALPAWLVALVVFSCHMVSKW